MPKTESAEKIVKALARCRVTDQECGEDIPRGTKFLIWETDEEKAGSLVVRARAYLRAEKRRKNRG